MFKFASVPVMVVAGVAGLALIGLSAVEAQQISIRPNNVQLQQIQYPPTPFEYSYTSEDPEGSHSAQSSGDGNGRVTGSYSLTLADGRTRTVNYVADENGYRAEVTTNELGTESKNSADVIWTSSAPTGIEAAIQFGPPREIVQQRSVATAPVTATLSRAGGRSGQRGLGFQGGVNIPTYGTFAGTPN
ncbi:cuticle protein 10.9-like [Tropilaelaps mercedesae]|uniref:Cuticle protein 10.9-like n=1 Tax=Tropilaelaps mercedesae TaxID=418985 RepID=A0A1V9XV85_9ACAR|nr:cuticle protein 10.9-like [Tropilaelaps mercedesae]